MILPAPRIIAIDDSPDDLQKLVQSLNRCNTACLPIHFTGDSSDIERCPHVRIIFADLHLNEGGSVDNHSQHFGLVGSLIEETIIPSGPYILLLWTKYPDQAIHLEKYLEERLQSIHNPLAVEAIDKAQYLALAETSRSGETLSEAIFRIIRQYPEIAAFLDWEERVLGAAANTVSSILELARRDTSDATRKEIGRLFASLAVESVGEEHVEEDRFRAVNEALLPILADRIASMRSREADNELWRAAFEESDIRRGLSLEEAAKLNLLLHIAVPPTDTSKGNERGAVIALPDRFSGDGFESAFDLVQETAAHKQFWRREETEKGENQVRWVLVQTQAACDYAQAQPGPLPFHLGLCLPASEVRRGTPPAALWRSPCFDLDGKPHFLHVNARFQTSLLSAEVAEAQPLFRLREQLLSDLIYRLHSHGARPGIISFREKSKKK